MKVSGEYTFEAPRELVWEALNDPSVLAKIMPGCEKLAQTGDNEYEGALKIKVGPVQGTFQGKIKLSDIQAPERYKMEVTGQGAPGFVKGAGGAELEAQDDKTKLRYDGDAQVGGRIASVGQRLIESSAKSIINQSLEGLHAYLKAKQQAIAAAEQASSEAVAVKAAEAPAATSEATSAAAPAPAAPPPSPKVEPPKIDPPKIEPPSISKVAFTVAKDVSRDVANNPPSWLYLVVALLVGFIWGRRSKS